MQLSENPSLMCEEIVQKKYDNVIRERERENFTRPTHKLCNTNLNKIIIR